ncbi:hypothetical protein CPHO_04390 [Corynebacterium phocae]|uniref:Permease n=1 Tax=Corynebacterium phocae TaxID=161895 RepID=A0A1L7D276_9CORY|nr:hypothetical protein [Corynebacterium phocae]APT92256.1 hypothetical protein CPHO_04390 [Corynebacterium phocae]KAA8725399.1 permease [Corynebacterium phocae]
MKKFREWPGNFKFAVVCGAAAVLAGVFLLCIGQSGMDYAMAGVAIAGGLVVVLGAPAWGLNDHEETARRKRARQARAELRRR